MIADAAITETCPRCRGWVWHRTEPCNCRMNGVPSPDHPDYLKALGKRLRACREEAGLSLDKLAERAGMSKTGLWEIEQGHNEPMARTVYKLAIALAVTTDFLLMVSC